MDNDLLTIDEVAKLLKVYKSHVFRLMKNGKLLVLRRSRRYTRIPRNDLMTFIQRYREETTLAKEVQK